MEKCSGASGNQDGGDPSLFIEIPCTFQKWSDGLFFPADHALHEGIPHHKIGGRSILVKKKNFTSGFHTFHDPGSLGSAAAGILCRKAEGVFFVWKIVDKKRNIYIFDKTAIFRAEFLGRGIGNNIFTAITGNMVVNTQFQCVKQGRLAVVAAAYDQCDAAGNAHACDGSSVGQIHGNPQVFRRNKRNGIFHRAGRDAAFPGKDGSIVYKSSQGTLRKFLADIFLVFGELDGFFQTAGVKVPVKERFMHADREKIEEDFFQFGGVDGSAIGRETDKKPGSDAFFRNLAGSTRKNFLTTVTDGDKATFSGAFCTEGIMIYLLFKLSVQEISQCDTGQGILVIFSRKSGVTVGKFHADMRRRCKRISLYVVNRQNVTVKLVCTPQGLVCGITFAVDAVKKLF